MKKIKLWNVNYFWYIRHWKSTGIRGKNNGNNKKGKKNTKPFHVMAKLVIDWPLKRKWYTFKHLKMNVQILINVNHVYRRSVHRKTLTLWERTGWFSHSTFRQIITTMKWHFDFFVIGGWFALLPKQFNKANIAHTLLTVV